jgi:hypothetical protein
MPTAPSAPAVAAAAAMTEMRECLREMFAVLRYRGDMDMRE